MAAGNCGGRLAAALETPSRQSYYGQMKRASVTEAKNQLSALLDRVRRGERVVIEDRGMPVARLDPVFDAAEDDDGRLARLERSGLARRPDALLPRSVLRTAPPRPSGGARLSQVIIDERSEGR